MSVIWSGITEEGAVVPVQVTEEGKVVAVGDGPEGDYVKKTGDNMTGDLTLGTDKITLNADGGEVAANTALLQGHIGFLFGGEQRIGGIGATSDTQLVFQAWTGSSYREQARFCLLYTSPSPRD